MEGQNPFKIHNIQLWSFVEQKTTKYVCFDLVLKLVTNPNCFSPQFSVKPDSMFSDHVLCQLIILTALTVTELVYLDK